MSQRYVLLNLILVVAAAACPLIGFSGQAWSQEEAAGSVTADQPAQVESTYHYDPSAAQTKATAPPALQPLENEFSFILKKSLNLRDENMKFQSSVRQTSKVAIDADFLKRTLGTHQPTDDQLREFFLNPSSVAPNLEPKRYYDSRAKRWRYDQFVPVHVQNADGNVTSGQMALGAAYRMGAVKMNLPKGAQPTAKEDEREAMAAAENRRQQQLQKEDAETAARTCVTCSTTSTSNPLRKFEASAMSLNRYQGGALWDEYTTFATEFRKKHKTRIGRYNNGTYKRLFLKKLIGKFGEAKAALILQAMTAFGEAPTRFDDDVQIGELAAVIKVINNRANNSYYSSESRILRDIGVQTSKDTRLSVILANSQFSAWNDGDNSLTAMLSFDPNKSDHLTKRRMAFAFAAQQMITENKIEFVGDMAKPDMHHYHANYVWPEWSSSRHRVQQPVVRIVTSVDGEPQETIDVDLSKQKGASHIFYAGVP
ncbi:MAG: hypothetical protein AB7K41_11270 [Bdellovibrionales bacterium]